MNREQARKKWEVIKAYGEGKELQYRRVGETEWHDERKHLGFCFDVDDCEFRIKPEENYTIEQNAGENWIEGGVLSLSVAPKELNKHCKWCKGKGCNCGTCSNKDEENSYYLLHKEKFPEPQERTFRPFKNCDELIEYWYDFTGVINCSPKLFMPTIWVKHKRYGTENLITAFDNYNESIGSSCVFIQDMWVDMKELFDNFTFCDGSVCGVEE